MIVDRSHGILDATMTRHGKRRFPSRALGMLLSACLFACQSSHDRGFDLLDAEPDGDRDLEAGVDSMPQPVVVCDEPILHESVLISESQVNLTSLDELPIGPFALAGAVDDGVRRTATIWLLSGQDMSVLKETTFDDEGWISVVFNPRASEFIAVASSDDTVTYYRLALVGDWDFEVLASREVCRGCQPSHSTPSPGPGRTALVTEDRSLQEARLHLIPDREDEEMVTSDPIVGTRPVVLSGTFGPLVLVERNGQIMVAQGHWNGTLDDDVVPINGGPFVPGYLAVTGAVDGAVMAALEQSQPSVLGIVSLDGEGRRVGRRELEGITSLEHDALTTNELTSLVAWSVLDSSERTPEVRIGVVSHGALAPAVEPTTLGTSTGSGSASQISVAAVSNSEGHTVMWSSPTSGDGSSLHAAFIGCHEE